MECRTIREKLSPYLEGSLPSDEKSRLESHLRVCGECGAALADLKKSGELTRDLEEMEPPPWLKTKILSRVAEEKASGGLLKKLFYPIHLKVPIQAVAAVFIAVIAVYVFKAVEPEMRQAGIPVPPGPIVTQEPAPKAPPLETNLPPAVQPVPGKAPEKPKVKARPAPAETAGIEKKGPPESAAARKRKEPPAERKDEVAGSGPTLSERELKEAPAPPTAAPAPEASPPMAAEPAPRKAPEQDRLAPSAPPAPGAAGMAKEGGPPTPPLTDDRAKVEKAPMPRAEIQEERAGSGGIQRDQERPMPPQSYPPAMRAPAPPAPPPDVSIPRGMLRSQAPPPGSAGSARPKPVTLVVSTPDPAPAAAQVEIMLVRLGARRVERSALPANELVTAELPGGKAAELLEKLKGIGKLEEGPLPGLPEGDLSLRIELVRTP